MKYKDITNMNLDLIVFTQEIIYLLCGICIKSQWICWSLFAICVKNHKETYFDRFSVKHISEEILKMYVTKVLKVKLSR